MRGRDGLAVIPALLLCLALAVRVEGQPPYQYKPYDGPLTSIIRNADLADQPPSPTSRIADSPRDDARPAPSVAPTASPTPTPKPTPTATPRPKPRATPKPQPVRVASSSSSVSGVATWYCWPGKSRCTRGFSADGAFGAAGPELRDALGDWRGQTVYVNGVAVTLIDWCACGGNHVIDVYHSTWVLIPDREWVTVRW